MNAIAFCLDLILATLLVAALVVGLRLDRRLKALKDSQSGFVNAVADLDASLANAQESLAALKSTAAIAESAISDRVQDAKGATARLDQNAKAATIAAEKLERLLERYPSAATPMREREREPAPRIADAEPLSLRDRIAAGLPSHRPLAREALSRAAPAPAPAPIPRSAARDAGPRKASSDDDLFELIEPVLRAARSAGR